MFGCDEGSGLPIRVLAVIGACLIGTVFAQKDDRAPAVEDAFGARVDRMRERAQLPALAVAVVRSDGVESMAVSGLRCAARDVAVTSDDLWHLGSCGKAMTATMIARLVERGVLSWDATVAEMLPELGEGIDEAFGGLTLVDLLSHRAGLGSGAEPDGVWARAYEMEGSETEQRAAFVKGVLAHGPVAEVGTYHYSNAGYAVAGYIAEVATGESWEELMRVEVFEPLGMESAGFGVRWRDPDLTQPWGHRAKGKGEHAFVMPGPKADNPPAIGPAGTMHMSMGDWAAFIGAHLRGARGEDGLILKKGTFAKLHTPPVESAGYALGWGVMERGWAVGEGEGDRGRVMNHAGSNTTWYCVAWVAPEIDLAVLVATNTAGAGVDSAVDRIAWSVIEGALGGGGH